MSGTFPGLSISRKWLLSSNSSHIPTPQNCLNGLLNDPRFSTAKPHVSSHSRLTSLQLSHAVPMTGWSQQTFRASMYLLWNQTPSGLVCVWIGLSSLYFLVINIITRLPKQEGHHTKGQQQAARTNLAATCKIEEIILTV